MNILIIDNGSKFINHLKNSLKGNKIHLMKFGKINLKETSKFDKIILSGGSLPILNHKKEYSKEIKLIKQSKIPILGICLGFELIAVAFGEKIERMETKEKEIIFVEKIKEDKILEGLSKFKVFESHQWLLRKCKFLIPLAKSKKGIEIIGHPRKEIYGLQFHPEMFHSKTKGLILLKNFIN